MRSKLALEPLFAFLATQRPFAEVSRLDVVSRNWRTVVHRSLKTAPQLNLSGFAESVRDEDARVALVRVTSENLKRVDLSGCHNISAGCMEDILQYMTETCSGVNEVDVTACSNEAVLRAVATRARAVCGVHSALDLYTTKRLRRNRSRRAGSAIRFLTSAVFCMQAPHSCCLIQSWPHAKMRCFRPPRTALALTWPCS